MTSPRVLFASLTALLLAGLLFAIWPSLDVTAAGWFFGVDGHFVGQGVAGNRFRWVFSTIPFLILGVMALFYVLRRCGVGGIRAPSGAGVLMMTISLLLGPGLMVNVLLKDHSHRPRPYYLKEFGGPAEFRPFYRFDGTCVRNCSFASGEGASAFWTLAPAMLAPPAVRPAAIAAALLLGVATSALRMAFGGHFLSDTVIAALLTWLSIVMSWHLVARLGRRFRGPLAAQPRARGLRWEEL